MGIGIFVGEDLVVQVEDPATPGSFLVVADLNRYSTSNTRPTNRFPVFAGSAHETTGERAKTFTLSGFWNNDDPGQLALRAASDDNAEINIRVLPDGVNGFQCMILVGTEGGEATADEASLQTISFDCEGVDDPTPIGTGIIV
jgi:hypothetical protein